MKCLSKYISFGGSFFVIWGFFNTIPTSKLLKSHRTDYYYLLDKVPVTTLWTFVEYNIKWCYSINGTQVNDLRKELEARTLSSKGLKSQLIARLTKAIKTEVEKEEEEAENKDDDENEEVCFITY